MAAPTFIDDGYTSFSTTTASKQIIMNTQIGYLLIVMVSINASGAGVLGSPPSGNGLTYTLRASRTSGNGVVHAIYTTIDTVGGSWQLTLARGASSAAWGGTVAMFRDHGGVGAVASDNTGSDNPTYGAPLVSLTTTAADSAIYFFSQRASTGGTVTWRTVNSITPTVGNGLQRIDSVMGTYNAYAAYWNNVGAIGSKDVGMTSPDPQTYYASAIEIKGIDLTAPLNWVAGVNG